MYDCFAAKLSELLCCRRLSSPRMKVSLECFGEDAHSHRIIFCGFRVALWIPTKIGTGISCAGSVTYKQIHSDKCVYVSPACQSAAMWFLFLAFLLYEIKNRTLSKHLKSSQPRFCNKLMTGGCCMNTVPGPVRCRRQFAGFIKDFLQWNKGRRKLHC